MAKIRGSFCLMILLGCAALFGAADEIKTSAGPLQIHCLGHASLMFTLNGMVIHVDPFARVADYAKLPDADLILITHGHRDHLDPAAIAEIRKPETTILCAPLCLKELPGAEAMSNGDKRAIGKITIMAVPAYNIVHQRDNGKPFHPKGEGNGYVLEFGDTRVYVAGDTENTPEMKALKKIDIAFLPVNLPYTMDAGMVMDAVKAFKPAILYPYHYDFGTSDLEALKTAMREYAETELRIRAKP